jgi:hypothetical protein
MLENRCFLIKYRLTFYPFNGKLFRSIVPLCRTLAPMKQEQGYLYVQLIPVNCTYAKSATPQTIPYLRTQFYFDRWRG